MRTRVLCICLSLLMFGCTTERYFIGDGVEALVYQENHTVELNIKNKSASKAYLTQLIESIEKQNADARYTFVYRQAKTKALFEQTLMAFPELKLKNHRVSYQQESQLRSDALVKVTLHKVKTERCAPSQVLVESYQRNCFVESSRMQQVVNKSKLVGE